MTAALKTLAPEVVVDAQALPADLEYSAEGPYRDLPFNFPLPKALAAAAAATSAGALDDPAGVGGGQPAFAVPYKKVYDEAPMAGLSESFVGLAQTNNRQLFGTGYPPTPSAPRARASTSRWSTARSRSGTCG